MQLNAGNKVIQTIETLYIPFNIAPYAHRELNLNNDR